MKNAHRNDSSDNLESSEAKPISFSPPIDLNSHESGLPRPSGLNPIGMERRNRGPNVSRLSTYRQDDFASMKSEENPLNNWPSQFSGASGDLSMISLHGKYVIDDLFVIFFSVL